MIKYGTILLCIMPSQSGFIRVGHLYVAQRTSFDRWISVSNNKGLKRDYPLTFFKIIMEP